MAKLESPRRAPAVLAAVFLGPGAGHVALGRYRRGATWLALFWVAFFLGLWVSSFALGATLLLGLGAIIDCVVVRPARGARPRWGRVTALWVAFAVLNYGGLVAVRVGYRQAYKIPAGSMIPTLQIGDHIWVRRSSAMPRRGEVVVFRYPQDESKEFVKRVVAVGGDTVELRQNEIWLNGRQIPRRQLPEACSYPDFDEGTGTSETRPCTLFEEELDGRRYQVIQDQTSLTGDRPPVQVPPGHFYVVGDNRDNSHDSRYWGTVPLANLRGVALKIWYSSGPPEGTRWKRVDRPIR